jgi:hypothetical protein
MKGNKLGAGETEIGGNIPDLRGKFVRGTDLAHNGETGGSAAVDLSHHHVTSAAALDHSHTVGAHNHQIVGDGNHLHGFADARKPGGPFHQLFQRVTKYYQVEGEQELQSVWDTYTNSPGEQEVIMQTTGQHSHSGNTGMSGAFFTGGSTLGGNIATDTQLEHIDTTPPFVGLCFIMRVK